MIERKFDLLFIDLFSQCPSKCTPSRIFVASIPVYSGHNLPLAEVLARSFVDLKASSVFAERPVLLSARRWSFALNYSIYLILLYDMQHLSTYTLAD